MSVRALERRTSHLCYRALMLFHKPLMFTDYYFRAYRHARAEEFDVYHAHDLNTLPVAAALAYRTGGRLVYDSHELYTEVSTLSRLERRTWRLLERRLIRRADTVITVCQSIGGELVERYGIDPPTILLNCPPASAAPSRIDGDPLRTKLGLEHGGEPIVLYQGGFAEHRGLPELIEAAKYLERGLLVLMGWGKLEDELARKIQAEGVGDRVRMTGPADPQDLLRFTAGADVGVIPYRPVGLNNTYTTPNKLFEYMAAGVAVAGSRLPELRRFVEGEGAGVTFNPDDPQDIAMAINHMLGDEALLAEMKANARRAASRFVWEAEAEKLLALYAPQTLEADGRHPLPAG